MIKINKWCDNIKLGTNEDVLVEILCSRPFDEIQQICAAYETRNY